MVKRSQAQINARNRRAGARWETDLVTGFRSLGLDTERLRLSGKQDEGDLVVRGGPGRVYVFEAKNTQTWTYSKLLDYAKQARVEASNYAARRNLTPLPHHAAVMKVHGKGWQDGMVLLSMREYLRLMGETDG